MQAVTRNQKLLVCAPSNIAVDNLLERVVVCSAAVLDATKRVVTPRVVRLGHPARVTDKIIPYCLDAIIGQNEVPV